MPLNDKQMNQVLTKVAENIPSDCSAYEAIQRKSKTSVNHLNSQLYNLTEYQAYRNDIEFVNSFKEQVLLDEELYFTRKYSSRVYNYLKSEREKYNIKATTLKNEAGCNNNCPTTTRCMDISGSNTTTPGGGTAPCQDKTGLISFLQGQLSTQTPETIYKKIEYRDEAHEFLSTMNNLLTIFYFLILGLMLVILIVTQNVKLKERFILYLFLILQPFLFPYFYDFVKYLYSLVFPRDETHGPKNAFLESKDTKIVDGYNI